MKRAFLILGIFLLTIFRTGASQMDANSTIELINFSKTLIQDGEISFLFYEQFPKPPDEKGKRLREIIAFREKELSNAAKDTDPGAYRQAILENLENEKRYEPFRESDDFFIFVEASLVFRMRPDYATAGGIDYWMNTTDRFERHPSLGSVRFFSSGYEYSFLGNGVDRLKVLRVTQFHNTHITSGIDKEKKEDTLSEVYGVAEVPPTHFIDLTRAKVESAEFGDEKGFIITHFPFADDEEVRTKVYIRFSPLPEVFREEYYFQSESPNADMDGYWLRTRTAYSDFQVIEDLNLAIPKVRIHKEFRPDGWLHRQTVYTIKEMNFNLGFPDHFFDLQETDLDDDKGVRHEIRKIGEE